MVIDILTIVYHQFYFNLDHLYQLSIQELYYIVQIDDMIIPSEKYLLGRILSYYNEMKKKYTGDELEEFVSDIKGIIKFINYGADCLLELMRYKLLDEDQTSSSSGSKINRVYFSIYIYIYIFI